jgi:hypothetical protein
MAITCTVTPGITLPIMNDLKVYRTCSNVPGDFRQIYVGDISTTKTLNIEGRGDVEDAILYVALSVPFAHGAPTITLASTALTTGPVFGLAPNIAPRPATDESRVYRFDVGPMGAGVVTGRGAYSIVGSALSGGGIYYGATIVVIYRTRMGSASLANRRTILEIAGAQKVPAGTISPTLLYDFPFGFQG